MYCIKKYLFYAVQRIYCIKYSISSPLPGIQVFKYSGIQKNKLQKFMQIEFLLYIIRG